MLDSTYSPKGWSFDPIIAFATRNSSPIAVLLALVTILLFYGVFYHNPRKFPPGPSRSPIQSGRSAGLQPYQIFSNVMKRYGTNYTQFKSSTKVNLDIFARSYFRLLSRTNPCYRWRSALINYTSDANKVQFSERWNKRLTSLRSVVGSIPVAPEISWRASSPGLW